MKNSTTVIDYNSGTTIHGVQYSKVQQVTISPFVIEKNDELMLINHQIRHTDTSQLFKIHKTNTSFHKNECGIKENNMTRKFM